MSKTTIEWTERTWNPVRGCSPVSPGCLHCYAEQQGGRFCGPGRPFDGFIQIGKNGRPGKHWTGKVELIEHMLAVPLHVKKPTTWFVNSMSDLFHEALPDGVIDQVFAVMALCPQHTFQVLTKRSKRMREYFGAGNRERAVRLAVDEVTDEPFRCEQFAWPIPNIWLGVSVEDQPRADERIPDILATPAAVRFLSCEPLLGPVDLSRFGDEGLECNYCKRWRGTEQDAPSDGNIDDPGFLCPLCGSSVAHLPLDERIDWVIVGGESGSGARPFDLAWARSILEQCRSANVPCFVKQLGARPAGTLNPLYESNPIKLTNKKGGDMAEWPADLRVRQTPVPR